MNDPLTSAANPGHGDPIAPVIPVIPGVTGILLFAITGRFIDRRMGQPTVVSEFLQAAIGQEEWCQAGANNH